MEREIWSSYPITTVLGATQKYFYASKRQNFPSPQLVTAHSVSSCRARFTIDMLALPHPSAIAQECDIGSKGPMDWKEDVNRAMYP